MRKPRHHLTLEEAGQRLAHSRRWIFARIEDGSLEAFKHSRRNITVSLESLVMYEESVRILPTGPSPGGAAFLD